ncbi:MAG TPA: hypothetical protein VK197_05775, partial [Verrucomicrobiae bacterium]|nr:hypothetical protein [Verrucomicrobiae bacterium]
WARSADQLGGDAGVAVGRMVGAIVGEAVGADVGEAEGGGAIAAAHALTAVAESALRSCLRRIAYSLRALPPARFSPTRSA